MKQFVSTRRLGVAATLVAIALGTTLAMSGCNRGDKTLKLAFVTNNASEFWKLAIAGVRQYEKEGKVQVDVKLPSNGKTPAEQNEILLNLASQGYSGIAVSAIAPDDQVPILDKIAKTAKLITFDSDAPKSNRLLYIGTDNFQAGQVLGKEIVKLLPHGGKMAVFVGTFSADNAQQRLKGIEDAIKGHDIEIVAKKEDNTDRNLARTNVEDVLNSTPDLDLVTGLWSYNGPAIASAIEGSHKQGKVKAAVFDQEDGTLKGIKDGTITLTVVQNPDKIGYLSAKWMHDLVTEPEKAMAAIPANKTIFTGVDVVDSKNIEAYTAKMDQLKKEGT